MDQDPTNDTRLRAALALDRNDPAATRAELESIVRDCPDFLPARRALAQLLRTRGDKQAARQIELAAIAAGILRPSFAVAQNAYLAEDFEAAERLIRAHLRQDPQDPAAALMLGQIAKRCKAVQEAENLFRRSALLAPSYMEAHFALATLFRDTGRYEQALDTLDVCLALRDHHLPSLSLKASIFEQLRRFEEADTAFQELHYRHPNDARGWSNHAFMLKTIGRQKEAVAAYRQALTLDPAHALAWWGLSNLKTLRFDFADVTALHAALDRSDISTDDRIHLCYALGKALEDLDDHPAAFAAFSQGAALRLSQAPYDPAKVQAHVDKSRRTCTAEFFASRKGSGCAAPDPIFIVSLPRSGSTLVEQILASHPLIEGTEELHDLERIALAMAPTGETGGWLDVMPSLSAAQLADLGRQYIESTRRFRHTDRPYFTDKMPSNWVYTGLIQAILPNAKIVDIRRHPLGCGFANFSQHFNWGVNFSYDLQHIGGFYSAYVRQMAHFDKVNPGRVHHLTHEALVGDLETEVRDLLNYCGLVFDPACLRFFENKRAVYTPSSEQVRSPISRNGVDRWRNYEPFLEPLKASLGAVLSCYPEPPPSKD